MTNGGSEKERSPARRGARECQAGERPGPGFRSRETPNHDPPWRPPAVWCEPPCPFRTPIGLGIRRNLVRTPLSGSHSDSPGEPAIIRPVSRGRGDTKPRPGRRGRGFFCSNQGLLRPCSGRSTARMAFAKDMKAAYAVPSLPDCRHLVAWLGEGIVQREEVRAGGAMEPKQSGGKSDLPSADHLVAQLASDATALL